MLFDYRYTFPCILIYYSFLKFSKNYIAETLLILLMHLGL